MPELSQQSCSYAWRVNFKHHHSDKQMVAEVVIAEEGPGDGHLMPADVTATIMAAYPEAYIWSCECVGPVVAAMTGKEQA